jgi:hypothetical protein
MSADIEVARDVTDELVAAFGRLLPHRTGAGSGQ